MRVDPEYRVMKALQIQKFGEPADALKLAEITPKSLPKGEVRVRIKAAGINPSDLGNARGAFPSTTLPRVIGRDFAGEIVEGPRELIGLEVWGSGGDLGFTRDGTHAETIDIPIEAVSLKPKNLSAEEAAVVGVPFVTAYSALEATRHKRGEWAIITGAAGSVGSAAIELVYARGGFSIALVKDAREQAALDKNKVKAVATSEADNLAEVVREATNGRGADVALNGIGGTIAPVLISSLASGGRKAVYGAAYGGREFQLDLFPFYRNRLELIGVNTGDLDVVKCAPILDALRPLFESGSLDRPRIAERYPLDAFAVAYDRVRAGVGKVVLFTG
jgi:NADPH2:quinone reductase